MSELKRYSMDIIENPEPGKTDLVVENRLDSGGLFVWYEDALRLERERDEARGELAAARAELAEAMAEPTKKPLVTDEHEGYHGRWISDTDHENRMCAVRGERNRARKDLTAARAEIARMTIALEASQGALRDTIRQMADYAKGTERMTRQRDNARIERNGCSAEIARRDGQINTLRDMHTADAKEIARLNAVIAAQAGKGKQS